MNKKILYKLLLIFALLACILLINNTKSFATDGASDNTITINDVTYTMPSWFFTKEYRLLAFDKLVRGSSGDLYTTFYPTIICSDEPLIYNSTNNTIVCSGSTIYGSYTSFNESGVVDSHFDFSYAEDKYREDVDGCSLYFCTWTASQDKPASGYEYVPNPIFYTTHDILNENDEVVFQQPPQVMEQVGTLAPIVEGVEAKKTLTEVVGILPVVLVVIVGLLAMRKAIAFLMRILKQG